MSLFIWWTIWLLWKGCRQMRRYLVVCIVLLSACSLSYHRQRYGESTKPIEPIIVPTVIAETYTNNHKMKTVAVIDTGIRREVLDGGYDNGICKFGHKDLTGNGLNDTNGHGTNVSGLIQRNAGGSNYCQVIIKYYDENHDRSNIDRFIAAIRYAIDLKVDYINISGGGPYAYQEEKEAINKALEKGIKIISAAGNNHSDLDVNPYYPAYYSGKVYVVGNGVDEEHKAPTSNYGHRVNLWRDGQNQTAYGITNTGTSQATAIFTGELIKQDCEDESENDESGEN